MLHLLPRFFFDLKEVARKKIVPFNEATTIKYVSVRRKVEHQFNRDK
jgi:hypothetical protein